MEARIGDGGAVRGDEQIGPAEKRRRRRDEADLDRPVGEGGDAGNGLRDRDVRPVAGGLRGEGLHERGRAAAGQGLVADCFPGGVDKFLYGILIERIRLRIDDHKRAPRAFAEAGAQAVAVLLRHEPRLAVHDPDGALRAGGDAEPAAVAFFFIDPDDFSGAFHNNLLILQSLR